MMAWKKLAAIDFNLRTDFIVLLMVNQYMWRCCTASGSYVCVLLARVQLCRRNSEEELEPIRGRLVLRRTSGQCVQPDQAVVQSGDEHTQHWHLQRCVTQSRGIRGTRKHANLHCSFCYCIFIQVSDFWSLSYFQASSTTFHDCSLFQHVLQWALKRWSKY